MVLPKPGDWYCLQCRNLNFASRQDCRHCGAARTNTPEEESPENMMDAEAWLDGHDIDEDKMQQFLDLPEDKQQIIILKGPLKGCRDPTAVLVSRLNALPVDKSQSEGPRGEYEGRVKSYSVFKGVGFILPDVEGEPDIFLHLRSIVDGSTPSAGDVLTFDLEPADKGSEGQMKAINVRGGSGYPLTEEQKGKDKGKGKGKDGRDGHRPAGRDDRGGGGKGGRDGPYGKGHRDDPFGFGSGRDAPRGRAPPVDRGGPLGEYEGRVKSYSVFKGVGFILPGHEGEPDIFLHVGSVVDGSTPSAGDILSFDLEPAEKGAQGQMKAVNVRGGTGYPLTEDQKGKDAGKGKGKDGKDRHKGRDDGPYGKGRDDHFSGGREDPYMRSGGGGGALGPPRDYDPYVKGGHGGMGWDSGKGGYGAERGPMLFDPYTGEYLGPPGGKGGYGDPYGGKGYDMGKGGYPGDYPGGYPGGYPGKGKDWEMGKGGGYGGRAYDDKGRGGGHGGKAYDRGYDDKGKGGRGGRGHDRGDDLGRGGCYGSHVI